jgi:ADP-ribosylation factor-like protein 3
MRVQEVKDNLQELLAEAQLAKVPLLVFANKQDMELALGADEVMEHLELAGIEDRTWNIQACSAMTQVGLNEGMKWLIETINAKNTTA